MQKAIITAAITGNIHTPSMSPYLPITPRQIADNAVGAYEAGAAVVHIHARDPRTGAITKRNVEVFKEIVGDIKSRCNVVVCITTGGGLGVELSDRVEPILALKPEMASLNFGSMNFCLTPFLDKWRENRRSFNYPWEVEYLEMTEELIFPNTFKSIRELCSIFAENNTKPEIEIYDVGMINNLAYMLKKGAPIQKPIYIQFVMGILGGIPATIENLVILYNTARNSISDFKWSVCAAGRAQMPICTTALAMGGNARVGLEDNLYLQEGVLAKDNAELVERIVSIAHALNIETATPDEAREFLRLKGLEKVNY